MLLHVRIAFLGVLLPAAFASPGTVSADDQSVSALVILHDGTTSWQEKSEALRTLRAVAVNDPSICFHVAKTLTTMNPRLAFYAIQEFFAAENNPCSSQNLAIFRRLTSGLPHNPEHFPQIGEDETMSDWDFIRFLHRQTQDQYDKRLVAQAEDLAQFLAPSSLAQKVWLVYWSSLVLAGCGLIAELINRCLGSEGRRPALSVIGTSPVYLWGFSSAWRNIHLFDYIGSLATWSHATAFAEAIAALLGFAIVSLLVFASLVVTPQSNRRTSSSWSIGVVVAVAVVALDWLVVLSLVTPPPP